ncbi:hypothetical protein BX265_7697 [Streptomyces sp. TLI_235]|nr:DUF6286 domain-containing protein [Streptomyces sp. TLI_235]PBC70293.1 hypothetical protein BX265_7697 [Streptomyces sp. TLI_235]
MTHQHPAVSDPDPGPTTAPGHPPGRTPPGKPTGDTHRGRARHGRAAPRWWSERRVPAAIVALVVLAACAFTLFDVVLALTPGRRHLLPMAAPDADAPQAALDRDGAARLLRDAALRVPGVSHADVRVRRRRINARAQVSFRDLETVHTEVTEALTAQLDALALARVPRLTVRARRRGL